MSSLSGTDRSGPLTVDGSSFGVDQTVGGTLRHEYGHHVHYVAEKQYPAAIERFQAAFHAGQESAGLPRSTNWETKSTENWTEDMKAYNNPGSSRYARTNWREAFAETFAKVTHPSYDWDSTPSGPVKDMDDAVLDLLDPEYTE